MLTTVLKLFDTFVIKAATGSSIALPVTRTGSIVIPISSAAACGLTNTNEVVYKLVRQKFDKHEKQYENTTNSEFVR